jgi:hypothetical protein
VINLDACKYRAICNHHSKEKDSICREHTDIIENSCGAYNFIKNLLGNEKEG